MPRRKEALDNRGRRRVVITGYGGIGPGEMGLNAIDFYNSALAGKSGIDYLKAVDPDGKPLPHEFDNCEIRIGGQVPILDVSDIISDPRAINRNHPVTHMSAKATHEAISRAGLIATDGTILVGSEDEKYMVGEIVASASSGTATLADVQRIIDTKGERAVGADMALNILGERPGIFLCSQYDIRGYNYTVVSACQSSGAGIADAVNQIRVGAQDIIIGGGVDHPLPINFPIQSHVSKSLFLRNRAMTKLIPDGDPTKASSPFSSQAAGFVLSSGASIFVFEDYAHAKARGAEIFGEVLGVAITNDGRLAHNDTMTSGVGLKKSMQLAFKDARVNPSQINLLEAHATSTAGGDEREIWAIKEIFGPTPDVLVHGPKSMTGHLTGASAAHAVLFGLLAMERGMIAPTINLTHPTDDNIRFVGGTATRADIDIFAVNSLGFGNGCSTLVIGRPNPHRWGWR